MRKICLLICCSGYIMATDLNDVWRAIEKNSYEYAAADVDLEKGQVNNLKAYSAALSEASISPSDDTVQIKLNFSPATFYALDSANKALKEKKYSVSNTKSVLMKNMIHDYFTMVTLVKQKKSLKLELKNHKKYLQKAQAEYAEGLISQTSLALWNTRYNQSTIKLIDLEAKITDLQNKIATQTGLDVKTISTFSNRNTLTMKPLFYKDSPYYVKASKLKRQSVQAAEDATYLRAIIPELTLSLSNQDFEPNKIKPSFSFSMNFGPVLEGMSASQDLRAARIDMLKLQRENKLKIQKMKQKLELFNKKIEAAKSSYMSAVNRYKAYQSELEAGKITEIVFSDSIIDVSKQRTLLIEAQTDLLKNHVSLLHEYGQINPNNIKELNKFLTNTEAVT
jgi:outer membrane protein TolC